MTGRPRSAAVCDLNGAERADLAIVDNTNNRVVVLRGIGGGLFGPPTSFPTGPGPAGITVGDFNGDGKLDLAVTAFGPPGQVSCLLGHGDGTFDAFKRTDTDLDTQQSTPVSIVAADLDGQDGDDLAVVNEAAQTISVLLSRSDGTFSHGATRRR